MHITCCFITVRAGQCGTAVTLKVSTVVKLDAKKKQNKQTTKKPTNSSKAHLRSAKHCTRTSVAFHSAKTAVFFAPVWPSGLAVYALWHGPLL